MTQVKECMTKNANYINSSTTVQQAAKLMKEKDIGFLPVGDNDKIIGIVTDRDLVVRSLANGKDITSTTVKDIMSPGCLYCFEEDSVEDVTKNLGKNKVHRLTVLNKSKRLVGVITLGDVSRKGAAQKAGEALSTITKH